mgnify:CR=1 FL=1
MTASLSRPFSPVRCLLSLGLLAMAVLLPLELRAQDSFQRGDANVDASVDLSDGILVLQYLFQGGLQLDCLDAADADDSGNLDLSDAIYEFSYLFTGGAPPPAPFAVCGEDPTADGLGCDSYELCAEEPPPAVGGRNILLIISDDQAWTDYGFMGHPHIETPHLDITYTSYNSPPIRPANERPSGASLWTD